MTVWHFDTSALGRLEQEAVFERLKAAGTDESVSRCALVDLELLRYAPGHMAPSVSAQLNALRLAAIVQADLDRALEVQAALSARGQHHGVPAVGLVVAAVAERAGATLLHYDAGFDRIAEVTGQAVEWVVPAGEAD